jgi:hypothetical protein
VSSYFGKYSGVVIDNADPDGRGRIKFKCESVRGPITEGWARPCVPFAGNGLGFFAVPVKDAHVWIEFEGGDVDLPIWTGCFWDESESAPKPLLADGSEGTAGDPAALIIKTDELTLTIHDDKKSFCVAIGDAKLVFDAGGMRLTFGGASVTLDRTTVSLNDQGLQVT